SVISDYVEEPLLPLQTKSLKETINAHKKIEEEREKERNALYLYNDIKKTKPKSKKTVRFSNIEPKENKRISTTIKNNKIYKIIELYNTVNNDFKLNLSIDKLFKNNDDNYKNTVIDISKKRKEYYNINKLNDDISCDNNQDIKSANIDSINENGSLYNSNCKDMNENNNNDFSKRKELEELKKKVASSINKNKEYVIKNINDDKSIEFVKLNSTIIDDENENYIKGLIDLKKKHDKLNENYRNDNNNVMNESLSYLKDNNRSNFINDTASPTEYTYSFAASETKNTENSSINNNNNNIQSSSGSSIINPLINTMIDSSSILINNSVKSISNNMLASSQLIKSSMNMSKANYSVENRDDNKFCKLYDNLKSFSSYNVVKSLNSQDSQNSDYLKLKNKTPNRALRRMLFERITNINDIDEKKNITNKKSKKKENENIKVNIFDESNNKKGFVKENDLKSISMSSCDENNKNINKIKRKVNSNNIDKRKRNIEINKSDKNKLLKNKTNKKKKFKKNTMKVINKKKKHDKRLRDENNKKKEGKIKIDEDDNCKSVIELTKNTFNNKVSLDSIGFQKENNKYLFESDDEIQEYSEFEPEFINKMELNNNINSNNYTNANYNSSTNDNVTSIVTTNNNLNLSEIENKIINAYNIENSIIDNNSENTILNKYDNFNFISTNNNSVVDNSSYVSSLYSNNVASSNSSLIMGNYYNKYNNFEAIIEEDNEIEEKGKYSVSNKQKQSKINGIIVNNNEKKEDNTNNKRNKRLNFSFKITNDIIREDEDESEDDNIDKIYNFNSNNSNNNNNSENNNENNNNNNENNINIISDNNTVKNENNFDSINDNSIDKNGIINDNINSNENVDNISNLPTIINNNNTDIGDSDINENEINNIKFNGNINNNVKSISFKIYEDNENNFNDTNIKDKDNKKAGNEKNKNKDNYSSLDNDENNKYKYHDIIMESIKDHDENNIKGTIMINNDKKVIRENNNEISIYGENITKQMQDNYAKGSNSLNLEWFSQNPYITRPIHITSYSNRYYKYDKSRINSDDLNQLIMNNINKRRRSYSQPSSLKHKTSISSKSFILRTSFFADNSVFDIDKQQYKITNSMNLLDQLDELEKERENNSLIRTKSLPDIHFKPFSLKIKNKKGKSTQIDDSDSKNIDQRKNTSEEKENNNNNELIDDNNNKNSSESN
ncbi:hypothetical protein PIROE2DRAFT_2795, partial [Piromyces sp. E2]